MWKTGLVEIKEGVYAYIQPGGSWFVSNSGLIVGPDHNVVVDSLATKSQVEPYLAEIKKVTKLPVRFLINTHLHADHIWTNHYFPSALTIAHANCRASVIEEEKSGIKELFSRLMPTFDFSASRYTPQDITFTDRLALYQGSREIRLIHLMNAHTVSDIIVHLPFENIVFCGDLLFSKPCTPFAMMGSIAGYIEALEFLIGLRAEVYIPGHGPIAFGNEALKQSIDYLKFVQSQAKKMLENKVTDYFAAATSLDLGEYSNWSDSERIIGNMARAFSELKGDPRAKPLPDTMQLFEKMLGYRRMKEKK